ncbi:unnamed protein product [Rangifer tarandus platyrhynchus]|uniref:Uncharacterized protein n=2 Tax=Rangifer tarandus platyrhynchus TaxID=3082113 RepID=A0ABN8YT92_RANTA|nr:unnamed protein product [Rangifer tarandus platyrhynchus]CAI9702376.1 unnamed protein product [Rangifer tarandus platyrhynchus]
MRSFGASAALCITCSNTPCRQPSHVRPSRLDPSLREDSVCGPSQSFPAFSVPPGPARAEEADAGSLRAPYVSVTKPPSAGPGTRAKPVLMVQSKRLKPSRVTAPTRSAISASHAL